MKIGTVEIKGKTALAPLARVTNIPFRLICKELGAAVVFSEMASSEGLVRYSEKSNKYLQFLEEERPVALQLFGSDPVIMGRAAQIIEKHQPDIIDINFGCPVRKVVENEAGSALLKDPLRMSRIVKTIVQSVSLPVTVKIRCGWDENSMPVSMIGKILEESGASAIAIHARTRQMRFKGKAKWSEIRRLKESVSIPVIGNGDVRTPGDARRMIEETGCDMVMIGRGAIGNPWIFREVNHYLKTGELLPLPSHGEKISLCLRQFNKSLELFGPRHTVNTLKKHVIWYLKEMPESVKVKAEISRAKNPEKILEILIKFRNYIKKHHALNSRLERKAS